MRTQPPMFRSLDQLSGDVAARPSAFFAANASADDLLAELEALRARQTDVDELEEDLAEEREWRGRLLVENAKLRKERDRARAERDTLRALGGKQI